VGDEVADLDALIEAIDMGRERIVEAEQPVLGALCDQRRREELRDRPRTEGSVDGGLAACSDGDLAVEDTGDRDARNQW
jgi:hypothetical protein